MTIRRRGSDQLEIVGRVEAERVWLPADLAALPGSVDDVGEVVPGFGGGAAPLSEIIAASRPLPEADHGTVESDDGHYRASIPLEDLVGGGWVLFGDGTGTLSRRRGGPLRVVIRAGRTLCWNVKAASVVRITAGPEPDSVPENPPH